MTDIKTGDLVTLKSGGPTMTVTSVREDGSNIWVAYSGGKNKNDIPSELIKDMLPIKCLRKV